MARFTDRTRQWARRLVKLTQGLLTLPSARDVSPSFRRAVARGSMAALILTILVIAYQPRPTCSHVQSLGGAHCGQRSPSIGNRHVGQREQGRDPLDALRLPSFPGRRGAVAQHRRAALDASSPRG